MKKGLTILLLLAALLLSSCSLRTEWVANKMRNALEGRLITQSTAKMEISLELSGAPLEISAFLDACMSDAPPAAYTDAAVTIRSAETETAIRTSSYLQEEDGALISYTRIGDAWTRETSALTAAELTAQHTDWSWLADAGLQLDANTQIVGGQKCHVLRCTVSGARLQQALGSMPFLGGLLADSGLEPIDISSVSVPTVYYVDTETWLPLQIEMSICGLDEAAERMFSESAGLSPDIRIGEVRVVYSGIRFDPVDIPAVPETASSAF